MLMLAIDCQSMPKAFENSPHLADLLAAGCYSEFIADAEINSADPSDLIADQLFEAYYRQLAEQFLQQTAKTGAGAPRLSAEQRSAAREQLQASGQLRYRLAADLLIAKRLRSTRPPGLLFWFAGQSPAIGNALRQILKDVNVDRHWLFAELLAGYFTIQRQQLKHAQQYKYDRQLLAAVINSARATINHRQRAGRPEEYHRALSLDLRPEDSSRLRRLSQRQGESLPWDSNYLNNKISASLLAEINSRHTFYLSPKRADQIVAEYNHRAVARQLATAICADYRPFQQQDLLLRESFIYALDLTGADKLLARIQTLLAEQQQDRDLFEQQFLALGQSNTGVASQRLARWLHKVAREYCFNFERRQKQHLGSLLVKHFLIDPEAKGSASQ